jgi:hypothetical protein
MSIIWQEMIYFAAFADSSELLYTKYNFNYDKYALDYGLDPTKKVLVFKDFLKRNGTTYDKPYTVNEEFTQYFNPITSEIINYMVRYGYTVHPNYMHRESPDSYIPDEQLIAEQFDLIEYTDDEIQRLQDYFFTENKLGLNFTKHNFQFDKYSNDFKVYGSKLWIFTDFVVRCINLSGAVLGFFGYGLPEMFEQYFAPVKGLNEYLIQYCVTSIYDIVYKNVKNINWESYKNMNPDLHPDATIPQLIDHYYLYGQFELREFDYNVLPNPENYEVLNSIATVYGVGQQDCAAGFLYSNVINYTKIYMITCYHLIAENKNKTTIRASLSYQNVNNAIKQPETVIAEFLIIGYDRGTDICISVYDPTLPWNIQAKVDISQFRPLLIDLNDEVKKGDLVTYYGNPQNVIPEASLTGYVIDNKYAGPFTKTFEVGRPSSILINVYGQGGVSGGPLFITKEGKLKLIGMINSFPADMNQYTQALNSFLLSQVIQNAITRYPVLERIYANNIVELQYQIQFPIGTRWLGCVMEYFNSSDSRYRYRELYNFKYLGGMIISKFILGFNPVTRRYVTNNNELSDLNIIQLKTPLLNTNMYRRFLRSGNVPIVIKSITYYNGNIGSYQEFFFGKYGDQVGFGDFSYGITPVGTFFISDLKRPEKFFNTSYVLYQQIIIKYFFNNGVDWVEEEETVKFTNDDLIINKNSVGNIYLQNPLDFPVTTAPYLKPYSDVYRQDYLGQRSDTYWGNQSSILGDLSQANSSFGDIFCKSMAYPNNDETESYCKPQAQSYSKSIPFPKTNGHY